MRPGQTRTSLGRVGFHIFACTLALIGRTSASLADENAARWVSWEGAEPDKGASIWFIRRHIDPDARIELFPYESVLPSGTPFDVPLAKYRRTHNAATLEALLIDFPSQDPVVRKIGSLMHDIEINLWRPKIYPESAIVERTTKLIAAGSPNGNISSTCFVALFDEIYTWLESGQTNRELIIPAECRNQESTGR